MQNEIHSFRVTDIMLVGRHYVFMIFAIDEDGHETKIATHQIETHQSLELFEFHHEQMIAMYCSLDLS